MSDDPYVYPGTDVLRNVRDIRDGDELEKLEARLTFLRGCSSPPTRSPATFSLGRLSSIKWSFF